MHLPVHLIDSMFPGFRENLQASSTHRARGILVGSIVELHHKVPVTKARDRTFKAGSHHTHPTNDWLRLYTVSDAAVFRDKLAWGKRRIGNLFAALSISRCTSFLARGG